MSPLAGSESFSIDGGAIGVLVSHGFTGMPASMRPWAEHLAAQGYTVRLPLLPGHGTTWQDLNATTWQDWYATIEASYAELAARCDQIFVCGLSMGGTLVTRLAEEKGDAIAGLVLVNPAYATERRDAAFAKYISWLVKSMPGIASDIKKSGVSEPGYDRTPLKAFVSLQQLWKVVLQDLEKVTAPVLLLRSREDHVVEPLSGRLLQSGATNTTVREIVLENSYHVATLDNDAPLIFDESVRFISDLVRPSPAEHA
ncbi:carboxylesterase [Frankineae bacterium MT45]|nr:carboxylesterase [Frankineae bacterium MT45]